MATALYRGDLCEDDPYEEWALRQREQFRESYLELLEELSECLLVVGPAAESVQMCERGLGLDRTREGLHVQLMRSHAHVGHLGEAFQVFERCRRALADELGVDPGAAARALHAHLLREHEPGENTLTQLDECGISVKSGATGAAAAAAERRLALPANLREVIR